MKKNYLVLLLLVLCPLLAQATHIRAGEITATRISQNSLTYRITLVTYTDEVNGKAANDQQNTVIFNMGFSTSQVEKLTVTRKQRVMINQATARNVYDTTYTFPAAGFYTIGVSIVNRNDNTVNLPAPGGSQNISFFVQTTILINSSIGFNSTPLLLNIPIDSAAVGQKFIHNPGAFDIDGDSLSYKLSIPRKDQVSAGTGATTGFGVPIPEYLEPNTIGTPPVLNQEGTGPATFSINPTTGDLIWDVPRQPGQYNVAFIIEEWRKGLDGGYVRIGEIVRDMQIIVVETDNKAPLLSVPPDICIEAGDKVEFEVIGTDENLNQMLKLTSSGGVYNLDASGKPANYIAPEAAKFSSKASSAKVVGTFEWQTNCQHTRSQAYNVVFKVEDSPGRFTTSLVDIKSINIRVLPPRPKALKAVVAENGNLLTWDALTACTEKGEILVYRKNGCSGLNPGSCTSGMPSNWGYQKIGAVSVKDTSFLDEKANADEIYSYRLVTEIQENDFINIYSAPSVEFCIGSEIKPGASVMIKVSIIETSKTSGEIEVRWSLPMDVELDKLAGAKTYKLYRAEGIGGENFTLIHTQPTQFADSLDRIFTDTHLNTEDKMYRYKVEFYTDKLMGVANPASSVRLNSSTSDAAVPLTWEANTPWSNENQIHEIYRELQDGTYNLIKRLQVKGQNSFAFTDTGNDEEKGDGDISEQLQNGVTYCYRILTRGAYEAYSDLGVFSNYSQVKCATPQDQSPPCTPVLKPSTSLTCEQHKTSDFCQESAFANTISWESPSRTDTKNCREDIILYNIYFGRYEQTTPTLLATVNANANNTFTHRKNSIEGFAGCYYVQAVNSLGLQSGLSDKICFDNCEKLEFPNVFSPNGDGKNDTFTPMNCPAFIKDAQIDIFSAHGQKVRSINSSTIEWDGKDLRGKDLSSGTYYYTITVTFERLQPEGSIKVYKGYVTLIR